MRLLFGCCMVLLSSGCATIQSTHQTDAIAADGFTYFLPVRHVKLTATKEALDAPKIKAALDAKTKDLDAAKVVATAAEQNAKAKADIVARLGSTAADATRAAAVQASELALAEAAIAVAHRDGLNGTVAGLKKLLEAAQMAPGGGCGYTAKLELLAPQADRSARFVARPRHNPLRDDSTKLTVTTDGLLSSSNVVSADRTGDIIVEIAGAIGALTRGPLNVMSEPGSESPPDCTKAKKIVAIFDPASDDEYKRVSTALERAEYPLLIKNTTALRDKAATSAKSNKTAEPEPAGTMSFGMQDSQIAVGTPRDAIFYRTPLPIRISVSECSSIPCAAGEDTLMEDVLISIPQAGPISYIPQRSNAFVKTVNDVQFENGVIKSWSADRPSEVLEVVRLPVRILTALISVPANLFQLRVNYDTQAKSLAEVQAAEIAAATRLQLLQACLDAAGEDSIAVRECLSK